MNRKDSKSKLLDMGHEEVVEHLNPASLDCLPDDLLVQILSFLPTKQAAATSLLSKRWRTLFAFNHNLDFDNSIFLHPENGKQYRKDIRMSFMDFVESTLALQGSNHIKTFSLKFEENYGNRFFHYVTVDRWICNALEHSVSELHLHITLWNFSIPSKFFTSTTLVKLSLETNCGFSFSSVPSDTFLPALKVLSFDSPLFEDDQLFNVFLAGCPALEDLLTIHYYYCAQVPYVISSKTIKKLSVIYNYYYYGDSSRIISLDIPNLVDLYYFDYPRHQSPHWHLDSLAKVTLNLHFLKDNKHHEQNNADLTNLISGLCNVKTLHLTSSAVEVISVCCKGGLPMFNNLVELVFSSAKRDWKVLPLLLERSPNLKILVLSGLHRYTFGRRHRFVGLQIPSNNQIRLLRTMQYQGSENELKHISHFLQKMECLEVLKVYAATTMDDPKKMQLTEDLLKLPTASSNLKIQVL